MSLFPSALSVSCALCGADCEAEARFCPFCGSPIAVAQKGDDALLGATLDGQYRLTERIGADGLARTYRADRLHDGEPVTVRVVHDHLARNRYFLERFAACIEDCKRLVHPGIVRVLGGGSLEVEGRTMYFIVTEPFEGRNLRAIVQARGLLPTAQVRLIGEQMLDALAEAHRLGMAHGDLRTENIVIGATADGEVRAKVADFCIGHAASMALPSLSPAGTAQGTPLYRAPEQIRSGEPSQSADVYAAGAVLYEQLTGEPPFSWTSPFEVERRHLTEPVVPPQQRAPDRAIPKGLAAVVLQALAKLPSARFADAAAMRGAIAKNVGHDEEQTASERADASRRAVPRKLIGRAELMDTLLRVAAAPVAYGQRDQGLARGAVAILIGGAGMGKSALVEEVTRRLEGGPLCVLRVDGREAISRPLEPFVHFMRRLFGLSRGDDAETAGRLADQLEARFHFDSDDVVRLVDRLTARPSSLAVSLDVAEREESRALRSVLGRIVAMRPTLLVVEDADALDPASLRLVNDLMEASATLALAVLVTVRGEPWPDWDAPHVTRIAVPGLTEQAALSFLRSSASRSDVSRDALRLAVTWAKGSPLLLDLCARLMHRNEPLAGRDGASEATSASQDPFVGLRDLVARNVRAAPMRARRWMTMAALAGVSAPIALLEAWEPAQPNRAAMLEACEATGLVRINDGRMVFRNEGVRDVVRALVVESEALRMHRFAAGWLQSIPSGHMCGEVIAAHLEMAGEVEQAAAWLERDARELLGRDEPRAAAELFARAQRLNGQRQDAVSEVRVGLLRVEALLLAGQCTQASDALGALESFDLPSAEGLRARVCAMVAEVQGDHELAVRALQRASALAVDSLDQHAWYAVEFLLAEFLYRRGALAEAQEHGLLAHELACSIAESGIETAKFEDGSRISQSASFLSRIRLELGRPADAETVLFASLEHPALLGDEASGARLLAHMAHARAIAGDVQAALAFGSRALLLARRSGDRMASARIALNVGAYQAELGKRDEALGSFALAKSLARAIGWSRGLRIARHAASNLSGAA